MMLQVMASVCVGLVTYLLSAPLIREILERDQIERDVWNRQEGRWQRLRASSRLVVLTEPWIRAVSRLVERRARWLIVADAGEDNVTRLLNVGVATVFGSPRRLDLAVRMRTHELPWIASELVAGGVLIALLGVIAGHLLTPLQRLPWMWIASIDLAIALSLYRLILWSFIREADERRSAVRQLLPHAIDVVAMVMSSGGTFEQGIESVVDDFPRHPLSKELLRLHHSRELGQPMREALEASANVVCLAEFDEFARVLSRVHGDGVPAAENFQRLAKHLRISHLRRMEEEVGKAEASMSFPTMCVLAASMLVCVAPFVLSMWESDLLK